MRYAFIQEHESEFAVRNLCHMLKVQRSGYYAWIKQPKSARQKDDERLLGLIKQFWLESGCVYGYLKTFGSQFCCFILDRQLQLRRRPAIL